MPKVAIIIGSESDFDIVKNAANILGNFNVDFEIKVLSAHRTPKELAAYISTLERKNVKVVIAAAGGAAALAGVVASHTILPVLGIPIPTKALKGLDSLLSTVQMPPGIPVGCMSIGEWGAKNAAIYALEILALQDKKIKIKLTKYRKDMAARVKKAKIKI